MRVAENRPERRRGTPRFSPAPKAAKRSPSPPPACSSILARPLYRRCEKPRPGHRHPRTPATGSRC